ncbi:hypothetical protein GUITHDRAFT_149218 [Guillardia theta CCMP2712]|uniref:Uncharacterized protein n=1 Tax=Guillardia theta (strain CCMP2712) TaxID=905079 RepID=L1I5L9_GUITC|nr:hypothetical protein GUITHDRAFT_149218 [Guillardia theta CCMP2712]EKX31558.1 hypothetical protein GUITHDRAFT_149218 [Guillardia theta CCMP2712]|eukprot:XP_005818538.1 hypothetical protein GUITHDRAFT_149218 [Guillardia theta CCMP2712]
MLFLLIALNDVQRISCAANDQYAATQVVDDDEDEEELDKPPSVHDDMSDKGNEKTRKDPPHVEQTPRKEQKVDDVEFDPEEFEGFEQAAPKADDQQAELNRRMEEARRRMAMMKKKELWEYYPEMIAGLIVLVYVLNYVRGSSKNRQIANGWLSVCINRLQDNFALVGKDNDEVLVRDSACHYTMYCSGRVNCESVSISLDLKPRQDLFSLLWEVFQPFGSAKWEDTVTVDVMLGSEGETGGMKEKFTLAVLQKSSESKVRSENNDLESAMVRRWKTTLHDSFSCIADDEEIPVDLIPDVVANTLNDHRQYIRLIHFSDKMIVGPINQREQRSCLRFSFFLLPDDRHAAKVK